MNDDKKREQQIKQPKGHRDEINLSDYPLDSLLIRTDHRSIWQVMRWIKSKHYSLERAFRLGDCRANLLWDEVKQSKLIESVLMRIPLPPFYLAEQLDGTLVVVDGLQRLNTFMRYINNEFALNGVSKALNGKKFEELPPRLKRRLETTTLTLFLIDSKVPTPANAGIFERVNSGVPFNDAIPFGKPPTD